MDTEDRRILTEIFQRINRKWLDHAQSAELALIFKAHQLEQIEHVKRHGYIV
jgi:hypothetical protein